jgi:hypothetical protein
MQLTNESVKQLLVTQTFLVLFIQLSSKTDFGTLIKWAASLRPIVANYQ